MTDLSNFSNSQLVDFYNALTGQSVKRFASCQDGLRRIAAAQDERREDDCSVHLEPEVAEQVAVASSAPPPSVPESETPVARGDLRGFVLSILRAANRGEGTTVDAIAAELRVTPRQVRGAIDGLRRAKHKVRRVAKNHFALM